MEVRNLIITEIKIEDTTDGTLLFEHKLPPISESGKVGCSSGAFMSNNTKEVLQITWTEEFFDHPMIVFKNMSEELYEKNEQINKLKDKVRRHELWRENHKLWQNEMDNSWWERLKFLFRRE